jgi:hypothetical protein
MATKKKLLQAAAGQAGGAGGLNVEDVFSTFLWEGDGTSPRSITNNIDLSGEGGAVWVKRRDAANDHYLYDTERGAGKAAIVNGLNGNLNQTQGLKSFTSDGFTVGDSSGVNGTGQDIASWTFRKAPKFFTCLTYTGNGVAGRTISHDLGSEVGCMIIKKTSSTTDANWAVYHRETVTPDPAEFSLLLNSTGAAFRQGQHFNDTEPTSTEFTLGNSTTTNLNGEDYVAYLFAHNDGDGEFGPDGDADIIKCGSYTGTGSDGNSISLGFEPQWVLVKKTNEAYNWTIFDNMRGVVNGGNDQFLHPNVNDAENSFTNAIHFDADGFTVNGGFAWTNDNNDTYIYIAIRRGPMAVPESATDVFEMSHAEDSINGTFPVDAIITKVTPSASDHFVRDRLRDTGYLRTNRNSAEVSGGSIGFDHMTGLDSSGWGTDYIHWLWKRAPNFFDVVAYTGNGTAGRTVSHNLGVAPEMMWIKKRSSAFEWIVYSPAGDGYLRLNTTEVYAANNVLWNATSPTSTEFTLGGYTHVNGSGETYIAYLFASLDGVSKVFSVTKSSGSDASVNCGFSAGPRFVLLKRTDSTGDWYVWDSERGIVSGNDPYLLLNSTAAEVTSTDYIDPTSNGFTIVNGGLADGDYVGYAVS